MFLTKYQRRGEEAEEEAEEEEGEEERTIEFISILGYECFCNNVKRVTQARELERTRYLQQGPLRRRIMRP